MMNAVKFLMMLKYFKNHLSLLVKRRLGITSVLMNSTMSFFPYYNSYIAIFLTIPFASWIFCLPLLKMLAGCQLI